ncbi:MAG TPA: hypothetical protein VHF06_10545 [Pseudonocardiaceae bacterium]|nr:hypothetical protein [Pseudonocardiaceae bacterium]
MPIIGRPRPAPIQPLGTGGGGAGQVQVDLAHLTTTGTNATQLGADMLSTVQRGTTALAEVGQHAGWAISGALGRCAAGWQAQLTSTSQAVDTVGTRLADTVAHYRDTENTNATAFRSIGQEIQR